MLNWTRIFRYPAALPVGLPPISVYAFPYIKPFLAALGVLSLLAWVPESHAGVLEAANAVRSAGCGQHRGVIEPLRRNAGVDRMAAAWSNGASLQAAEQSGTYRARRSVAVKLPANVPDAVLAERLGSAQCNALTDAEFRHAGLAMRGDSVWLVLAVPHGTPAAKDAARVADEVLNLVNRARSTPRRCGTASFSAAPPLRASSALTHTAQAHARDMARNDFLAHEGRDGSQVAERAQRAGYAWRLIGENVAGGPSTAREAVEGWLSSPGHCRNIMESGFTEMGVAFATERDSRLVVYWAQVFGRPR